MGLVILLALIPAHVSAGEQGSTVQAATIPVPQERVKVVATRLREPLHIDGTLDERAYDGAVPTSTFLQLEPAYGEAATEKTDIWVFFDGSAIYVSARCWDSDPNAILANEMRRDARFGSSEDMLAVTLDTFLDRRNAYSFWISAAGGVWDALITDERDLNDDWNGVFDLRTARFDQGWGLEMRIPFKTVRYVPGENQTWGINFQRGIPRKQETAQLSLVPRSWGAVGVNWMSRAADLTGLDLPPSSSNVEIKPYALGSVATDRTGIQGATTDMDAKGGFDIKYGIAQGLTLDGTFRTDFAQVEADLQQVNLTRFNLFFPEKREFFLENAGVFSFGGVASIGQTAGTGSAADVPIIFFSRQIGALSGRAVPVEAGGRLTGNIGSFNVGVVAIQTDDDAISGAQRTNFAIARVRRNILRKSSVGVIATRRTPSLSSAGANGTFGVDSTFAFFDNLAFNTYVAQTTSPDRSRDALSYRSNMNYNADRYGLELDRLHVGPTFNPEIGFKRRSDFDKSYVKARFSPRPASGRVRKYFFEGLFANYQTASTGVVESRNAQGTFRTEFQSGDSFGITADHYYEYLDAPFRIAEGVTIPAGSYDFAQATVFQQLPQRRWFAGRVAYTGGQFYGGTQQTVSFTNGRVRITPQSYFEPNISINLVRLPEGAFNSAVVGGRVTHTFSPRMFVAALSQYNSSTHSWGTNLRLRWEYSPGSELFAVYSDGFDTQTGLALQNRAVTIKVTRLVRF